MKRINKYIFLGFAALFAASCTNKEQDLLEPKVFFEKNEDRIEVIDVESMEMALQSRVSSKINSDVKISYEVAGADVVETFNNKYGMSYEVFPVENVKLEATNTEIESGSIYSGVVPVELLNLSTIEEGKNYVLPIKIASSSIAAVDTRDVIYYVITKPVRITKAAKFSSNYIRIPVAPATIFTSVTYEALIKVDWFYNNNTVMGREGVLIFRIGDTPLVPANILQIAGSKEFKASQGLETNKWYHVAFSYDQPTGQAAIYINGVKVSEAKWDTPGFDLGTDLFIGKVAGFMWGERPIYGNMSEVRLWNVSRTENQIKQNMISVDPTSEGLAAYYKLNGTDIYQEDGTWLVTDQSGNGLHGLVNGGSRSLTITDLPEPIEIK